jgi:predicted PurR-regulated permease PerM
MWILATLAIVWFLRASRTLLIPIALAVLISYALEPAVTWLERRHTHRVLGSAAVLLVLVGGIVTGAYALRDDATQLVEALPKAVERAREMLGHQNRTCGALFRAVGSQEAHGPCSLPACRQSTRRRVRCTDVTRRGARGCMRMRRLVSRCR